MLLAVLAACSSPPPPTDAPRNPPTLPAPTQFVEAQTPVSINNVANLRYLGRLDQPGTLSTIFAYAISPDSTRLVGLNNDEMLAWDLVTGSQLFQTARSEVTHVFYAPDKTEIYGIDGDGTVGVFDANTGAIKTTFPGNDSHSSGAAFSPDEGWLAVSGVDGTIKVWDTYARQSLVTITPETNSSEITALAFSPDGERLSSAGVDGVVRVWHWRDRQQVAETTLDTAMRVGLLTFSPDANTLAIGTNLNAQLWSLTDTTQRSVLDTGQGGASEILKFATDGRFLLAGNRDTGLSLWNLATSALAARLPNTQGMSVSSSFSPDGSLLLTTVLGGQVTLWNLVQLTNETVGQSRIDVGTDRILTVEWTDDGRLLLFFDSAGPVYLWGVG